MSLLSLPELALNLVTLCQPLAIGAAIAQIQPHLLIRVLLLGSGKLSLTYVSTWRSLKLYK